MHVPLCVLDNLWIEQSQSRKAVDRKAIEGKALSHKVFEELFNTRMVGSKEITFAELIKVYEAIKIFDYEDTVLVHAQEFTI